MSRPVSRPSPVQLLTNGGGENAIQSAVKALESAYITVAEWLQLRPEPAEHTPAFARWLVPYRQLLRLTEVQRLEDNLRSTMRESDHEAQIEAYTRLEEEIGHWQREEETVWEAEGARERHGQREREMRRNMQMRVPNSRLPELDRARQLEALDWAGMRLQVAERLRDLLKPFYLEALHNQASSVRSLLCYHVGLTLSQTRLLRSRRDRCRTATRGTWRATGAAGCRRPANGAPRTASDVKPSLRLRKGGRTLTRLTGAER